MSMETKSPSYPRKRVVPPVALALRWPNTVTNLAMNHAVACICRLRAIPCLCGFLFIVLLLNSVTERFTIKKKKKERKTCPDCHLCKWAFLSDRPLFSMGDIGRMQTSHEEPSCLSLSNCTVLLHILPLTVDQTQQEYPLEIQQSLKAQVLLFTS